MPRLPLAPLLEQIHRLDEPDDAWIRRIALLLLHRVRGPSGVNAYRFARSGEDGVYRSERIPTGTDNEADLSQYEGMIAGKDTRSLSVANDTTPTEARAQFSEGLRLAA